MYGYDSWKWYEEPFVGSTLGQSESLGAWLLLWQRRPRVYALAMHQSTYALSQLQSSLAQAAATATVS